jgi:hypothetical protein
VGRHKSLVSKFTQKGFIIDWGTSGFKKYEWIISWRKLTFLLNHMILALQPTIWRQ